MANKFFPERTEANPTIYAYEDNNPQYKGLLKVGFTTINVQERVAQQYPILRPGKQPYAIVLVESAMRNDGSVFTDHDVHRHLIKHSIQNPEGEWFKCTVKEVKAAVLAIRTGEKNEDNRTLDFKMRPEQIAAIDKTIAYFKRIQKRKSSKDTTLSLECQNAVW